MLYLLAAFAGFFSPYDKLERHSDYTLAPPMRIRIFDQAAARSFVYGLQRERHPETLRWINTVDTSQVFSVRLFAPGSEYRVLGLIRARVPSLAPAMDSCFCSAPTCWGGTSSRASYTVRRCRSPSACWGSA